MADLTEDQKAAALLREIAAGAADSQTTKALMDMAAVLDD